LCSLKAREFPPALQQQKVSLNKKLTDEEIEKIGKQFRELRLAFRVQDGLAAAELGTSPVYL
jgi:hypothetical protein